MATHVLGICILVGLAFANEKPTQPTYKEILIAAKSGIMPNSDPEAPDRSDSGHVPEGMNGIL